MTNRHSERQALDRLVADVRSGQGRALVVRGEPGMGKTVLLDHLAARAAGQECRVARAVGVQSEMELAFAGLHQLCAPMLDRAARLPMPQHDALLIALSARIVVHTLAGKLTAAEQVIDELLALSDVMRIPMQLNGRMVVAAWRGRAAEARTLIDAAVRELTSRGEGGALAVADYARAVLANGLGRYAEALTAASAADAFAVDGFTIYAQGLSELIEAAVRSGAAERAADALRRLSAMTHASGTDWGAGLRARCQALLSADDEAEARYQEAIERLGRTRVRVELARAHLLYGEWLRRQGRRVDAREQLRAAHQMLSAMGVEAFAERARHELAATGESIRKRMPETASKLTAHIARLAVQGRTNAEIGAQLFLSARTVEWHLRKVFTKLGIGSRRELRQALDSIGPPGTPPWATLLRPA